MKRIAIFAASVMLAAVFASCGKETGKYGINDKASDEVKVFDKNVEGEADLIDKAEALQSKVDDIFMKNNVYVELYVEMKDDNSLIKVDNFDDIKDKSKVAKTYNIVRYESGALMNLTEMPNPAGREFENIYNSLYDEQGNIDRAGVAVHRDFCLLLRQEPRGGEEGLQDNRPLQHGQSGESRRGRELSGQNTVRRVPHG